MTVLKKNYLKIVLKSNIKYSLKFKLLHLIGKEKKTFPSLLQDTHSQPPKPGNQPKCLKTTFCCLPRLCDCNIYGPFENELSKANKSTEQ